MILTIDSWKMFLPAKWRDPNVPPEASTALDPNMSLAHITHNTSMILLHQRIGYPEPELKAIKLPNYYSAETCQSAAIETLNIAKKYLENAPVHMLLSPHFSFCIYVSARVLLGKLNLLIALDQGTNTYPVHCRYYRVDLDPQFSGLVECLHIISNRWLGSQNHSTHIPLSSQFATSLEDIHELYQRDPEFTVNVVGSLRVESSQTRRRREYEQSLTHRSSHLSEANQASQSRSLPSAPLSLGVSFAKPPVGSLNESVPRNWTSPPDMTNTRTSANVTRPDDLSDILQTLTDERFMELDRVITFDDFNFDVETERLDNTSLSGGTDWNSNMQGWSTGGPP